jgi:hypothetical protein
MLVILKIQSMRTASRSCVSPASCSCFFLAIEPEINKLRDEKRIIEIMDGTMLSLKNNSEFEIYGY